MDHYLELRHEGRRHRGLISGRASLGLEQFAHPLTFRYSEHLERLPADAWCLVAGDLVEFFVDGELLLDAYVEGARIRRTEKEYGFDARCKAPTIDLVQCSHTGKRQFTNARVDQIARELVRPFGFGISGGASTHPIARFTVDRNESPFDALVRACRMRGLFPLYGGDGSNVISLERPGPTVVSQPLRLGGTRVLRIERDTDWSDRFSDYLFRGKSGRTNDTYSDATRFGGDAHDPFIGRYRPTRLQVRGGKGQGDAGTMARRERNQRAGRSESVTVSVSGWRTELDEMLWRPNMLVTLQAPEVALDDVRMLVTQVDYEFDEEMRGGFVSHLELKRPEALDPDATYPEPFQRGVGVSFDGA